MAKLSEEDRIKALIDAFATEMKVKLLLKSGDGWSGWRDRSYKPDFHRQLHDHAMRALLDDEPLQLVDVANYCAFLWHHARRPQVDPQSSEDSAR